MNLYEIEWKYKKHNVINTCLTNGENEKKAVNNFLSSAKFELPIVIVDIKKNISSTEKDIETIFKEQEYLSPNQLSLKDLSDEFEMHCLNTGGMCESHCTEVCIGCVLTWIFKNYNLIKKEGK